MYPVELLIVSLSIILSLQRVSTTPPQFLQFLAHPSDQVATGSAELRCSVSGSPTPVITWFKDGLNVTLSSRITQDSFNGSLHIDPLMREDDVGGYYCIATNEAGSLKSLVAQLDIAFLGSLPAHNTQTIRVTPNEDLELECNVPEGVPTPLVSWSPDPSGSYRIGVTLQGSLVFSYWDVSSGDIGDFTCSVTNSVTDETIQSSSYILLSSGESGQIFHSVEFVMDATPVSQSVVEGASVQFQCFTTGRAQAVITWEKNGANVMNSQRIVLSQANRVLTITEALLEDAGSYRCTAEQSSSSGSQTITSAQAQLTVIVIPTIVDEFPTTSVYVSESVSLSCTAEGDTPLSWQWRRNTELLIASERLQFDSEGQQSTLTISAAQDSDAGVYQCIVSQPATGYMHTASNLLSTATLMPNVTGDPAANQLVLVNTTVVFPCTATGFPPPDFAWSRGQSQPIDIDRMNRYSLPESIPGDGSLTITRTEVSDSSTLRCIATNSAGSAEAEPVQLVVIAVPMVLQSPMDVTPTAGQLATLPCQVQLTSSDISASYTWRRDGVIVHTGAGELNLPNVSEEMNGLYECVVFLTVVSIDAPPIEYLVGSAVVSVGGPPSPPSPPLNPTFSDVDATSFQAHWDPPLDNGRLPLRNYTIEVINLGNTFCGSSVEWETAVVGIDPNVLAATVTSLLPFTRYQFRVVAFNSVYRSVPSSSSALLQTAESAPLVPPSLLVAQPQQSHSQLLLTWQALSDCTAAGGVITGYTVEYRVAGSVGFTSSATQQTQLLLEGLAPSTSYELRVAARTASGIGPYTAIITETTSNEPPANLAVSVVNSTAVLLSWESSASDIAGFTVTYSSLEQGREGVLRLNASQRSVVITRLTAGQEYLFTVAISGENPSANVSLTLPPSANPPIYEQTWFIAVVPSVGIIIIVVVILLTVVSCFMCCYKCSSSSGKIYISSRRSVSSMSASSGFSEYQHKHKVMSRFVKVHASPTPSRRSTDYADLDSIRPNVGTGPSSINFTGSITPEMNGRIQPPMMAGVNNPDGYDHMLPPEKPQVHVRQMSGSTQQFFDTMHRVHTPPLPMPEDLNTSSSARMSDTTDESWNPTENLNYRGHMSNMVSRTNSERSTQSSEDCGGRFVRVQRYKQQYVGANIHNLHRDLRYPEQHFNTQQQQQTMSMQEMERSAGPHYPRSLEHTRHRDPHRDQLPPEPHTLPGYNNPRMMEQRIPPSVMEPVSSPQLQTLPEAFPEKYLPPPPPFKTEDHLPPLPPSNTWYAEQTPSPAHPSVADDIDMPDNLSSHHSMADRTRGNRPIAVQQYSRASTELVPPPTYSFPNKQAVKKNWNSAENVRFNANGRIKPKVAPKPSHMKQTSIPDVLPNNIAINKMPPSIPDLTSLDPRKPRLRQGKVPRSIWEQRPMNKAIESSSESDSDSSLDTVVPGDNTSLKSSHV